MVSTPPDAVVTTKPTRQSDTSESSDDDQPTPAKKMKQEDTKGIIFINIIYYIKKFYERIKLYIIYLVFSCNTKRRRRKRK